MKVFDAVQYLGRFGYTITRQPLGNGQWQVRYPEVEPPRPVTEHWCLEAAVSAAAAHHSESKLFEKY